MNTLSKTLSAWLFAAASIAALPGCQKQEGPAEQAGKSVDQAVEKVGQQIDKAGDDIKDATKRDKK